MTWWTVILSGAGLVLIVVILLVRFQHRLIYHPRSYSGAYYDQQSTAVEALSHQTSSGDQTAYLMRSLEDGHVSTVWIVFGGNAMLALDWCEILESFDEGGVVFLLVDYPGYGDSEGHSTPETIAESGVSAIDTFVETFVEGKQVPKVGIFGHSLGCAAALQLATNRQVDRVILSSPFTSTMDMTRLIVGRWAVPFLRHRFDNLTKMREVLKSDPHPEIHIFHGAKDTLIPVAMGRHLASLDECIQFHEDASSDHNTILDVCREQIHSRFVIE